jgi:hypothetical protein
MQYRDALLEQEVVYDQFSTQPNEPLPPQAVIDPGGAITGLSSNTLVVGGKVGTLQNVETPQPIGPGASPRFAAVAPVDAAGTNQPGLDIEISGGKGTGSADPGRVVLRYPLHGASGSTLHSLSADKFPVSASLYTNVGSNSAISNTAVETSLFTGETPSAGSTRTLEAGIARVGDLYRVRLKGRFAATASPTGRVRAKLGATLLADTTAFTLPNTGDGIFIIEFDIRVNAIGASGSADVRALRAEFAPGISGALTPTVAYGLGSSSINFTVNQTIDVTFQFGTADVANVIFASLTPIDRIR